MSHLAGAEMPEGSLRKVMDNTADFAGFKNKENFFQASIERLIAEKDAAGKNRNVYADISAWQHTHAVFPLALYQAMRSTAQNLPLS